MRCARMRSYFFFFNDTATTEIYTLSLHDALPILHGLERLEMIEMFGIDIGHDGDVGGKLEEGAVGLVGLDRKSTRLNSSQVKTRMPSFALKKKKPLLYLGLGLNRLAQTPTQTDPP